MISIIHSRWTRFQFNLQPTRLWKKSVFINRKNFLPTVSLILAHFLLLFLMFFAYKYILKYANIADLFANISKIKSYIYIYWGWKQFVVRNVFYRERVIHKLKKPRNLNGKYDSLERPVYRNAAAPCAAVLVSFSVQHIARKKDRKILRATLRKWRKTVAAK